MPYKDHDKQLAAQKRNYEENKGRYLDTQRQRRRKPGYRDEERRKERERLGIVPRKRKQPTPLLTAEQRTIKTLETELATVRRELEDWKTAAIEFRQADERLSDKLARIRVALAYDHR